MYFLRRSIKNAHPITNAQPIPNVQIVIVYAKHHISSIVKRLPSVSPQPLLHLYSQIILSILMSILGKLIPSMSSLIMSAQNNTLPLKIINLLLMCMLIRATIS